MTSTALGTLYCILSAVFYTLMGICQRELSENCDPVWVNCVQASVSTVVFGVYLTFRSVRGRPAWPPLGIAAILMALGAVTQLGGTSYQWSLGQIGLSVGNPLQMGVMLAASAILGLLILGEKVSWQAVVAIVLITVSLYPLSSGAESANEAIPATESTVVESASGDAGTITPATPSTEDPASSRWFWAMLGISAACFSGVAFALLTVGMRKTAAESASPEAIVFFINCMGILFLGPWAITRLGIGGMLATSPRDFLVMLATGVFNLLAFLLIAKALQLTTVVRVNVINNALTTALTVVAGILLFSEPARWEFLAGVVLTLIGIVLISYNASSEEQPETLLPEMLDGQESIHE